MDRQVQEAETVEDYRGEHLPGYDERDGVCRPILRIRVGQDYRSGNVEGAKHPHPGPPWCVGDVTQSRYALADQKHHRPEDERAHEKGDRRGRYRPSYRPAQLAIDGELYRYRGPAKMASSVNKACTSLLLPLSWLAARHLTGGTGIAAKRIRDEG